jgi:hypothetical protein
MSVSAETLDDLERTRTASQNRLRQMTRTDEDKDEITRGLGMEPDHPAVIVQAGITAGLEKLEKDAIKHLEKVMKSSPLGPWVMGVKGVGLKQAARLLAAVGDPYWNDLHDRPRTVSELWSYCGYRVIEGQDGVGHGVRHAKGQKSNWSTTAKTRAYLIAESCLKQLSSTCKHDEDVVAEDGTVESVRTVVHVAGCSCSPYRLVYDARRARTDLTRPGWSNSHNDGLRVAAKAILRDLWRAAAKLHGAEIDLPYAA